MILVDNISILKNKFPNIWNFFKAVEDQLQLDKIHIVKAQNGLPTLMVEYEGKQVYLHSKYNPISEAENWIKEYEEQISDYDHVFFYGIGFGYHIALLMNKYPDKVFSIYEPDVNIFYQYISHRLLNELPVKNLKNIYVEFVATFATLSINHFIENTSDKALFIPHPAYVRLFSEKSNEFVQLFTKAIYQRKSHILTTTGFEKLWTINSLHNFTKVLETQNILRDKKDYFKGKPVIMVAAGPSLELEFENLRKIKEEGLAYIFAIGSANKALIAEGIYPDAVTTYDPNTYNHLTFQELITLEIKDIPMIFGTSVGYNTVALYPGPMLHMVTSQDYVSYYYLKEEKFAEKMEVVSDAPTIAVITMELLYKTGCETLVLVGQNFAFLNNKYYSKGVNYDYRTNELSQQELDSLEMVESVDGGEVQTFKAHSSGRVQMEQYIANMKGLRIINTTRDGAKIAGTEYMTLDEVIKDYLHQPVVDSDWYKGEKTKYNMDRLKVQAIKVGAQRDELPDIFDQLIKVLRKMELLVNYNEAKQLHKMFPKLDKSFKRMTGNVFYEVFIKSTTRMQFELLQKSIIPLREMPDMVEKAKKTVNIFGQYLFECQKTLQSIEGLFDKLQEVIFMTVEESKQEVKQDGNKTDPVLAE